MTTEEKARAYDEAIKKAESLYKAAEPMSGCNVIIETLFPELKESEGERIRKELIEFVKSRGGFKQEYITWIEKQGKQKPSDEEMKILFRTEYEKGRADAIAEIQKRWSEEDELQMQAIIDLLPGLTIRHNWLKSLKGRVQPKQEWSEEDSVKLQRIIDFLWYNRKGDTDAIYQQEQDIDWLKSLRPKNRWKPSDEQIRFLQAMVNDPNNASSESCQIVLKDILEKLKKLKEE